MRIEIREKKLFKNLIKKNFDFDIDINDINSICTDSRIIERNDIFIPIKGKNKDGHQFINDVIKKGSSIVFSEVSIDNSKVISVNSTKETLKDLSIQWLNFFKKPIIAITGSNGKTTTKEMIRRIFDSTNKANYTIGNYNSSIGLPVNLFNFSLSANPMVLEMGANNPGEIDYLCNIAKPDFSIITNIQQRWIYNIIINTRIYNINFINFSVINRTSRLIITNLNPIN